MPYKPYWKSEFEKCLTATKGNGNLLRWEEISDSLSTSTHRVWEFVYRFHLKNRSASIIVYSSVYKKTEQSRDANSDAVRIVYEWRTGNGVLYAKIARKNRIDSLFQNLRDELISASEKCYDLTRHYSWVPSLATVLA